MRDNKHKDELQNTDLFDERLDAVGLRWSKVASVTAIVGVISFLGVFFLTDMSDRLALSQQTVQAEQVERVETVGSSDFYITVLSGDKTSKENVVRYLESLSDSDFKLLKTALSGKLGEFDAQHENLDRGGVAIAFVEQLDNGMFVTKNDMINYLNGMTNAEFDALLTYVAAEFNINHTSTSDVNNTPVAKCDESHHRDLKCSLEEAYAEAEARYPGKINASKRLKLIADLNAGDYLYYVVESGDTLIKLSEAFNVPLGQIAEINGIHDADVIAAGEILLFPSDTEQPAIQ